MAQCNLMRQRQQLNVRVKPELAEWLEQEARRRMVSKAFLIERALEELREREEVKS